MTVENRRAAGMRTWALFAIFLLTQCANYGAVLFAGTDAELAGRLSVVGLILPLGYGAVLLTLTRWNARYRNAGACSLAAGIINAVSAQAAAGLTLTSVSALSVILMVLGIMAEYFEYSSHASLMAGIGPKLSAWWRRLWKWYIYAVADAFISALLLNIVPVVGGGLLTAAWIVALAVRIGKILLLAANAYTLTKP